MVKNIHSMLYNGDTSICQNLVYLCRKAKASYKTQIHGENIILILRSTVKVIHSSWMYETHRIMVIHSRAKQSMTMSKDKKAKAWTQNHVINPINLTLRSKVNVVSGSWMYTSSHCHRPMCKFGMPMSKQTEVTGRTWRHDKSLLISPWGQRSTSNRDHECTCHIFSWWYTHVPNMVSLCQTKKKIMGRTWKHVKNPINFINLKLRSNFKVVSESWMYVTRRLMVIHPCIKFGKPVSNQKR